MPGQMRVLVHSVLMRGLIGHGPLLFPRSSPAALSGRMKSSLAANSASRRANARRLITRLPMVGFFGGGRRKLRRRQRIVRPADRLEQFFPVVGEYLGLLPPSCHRDIGRPLVCRRKRLAGHADEDLIHRRALAGVAGDHVAVGQMAEVAVDDPAVIDDDVAPRGESLDGQERSVAEAMLAVLRLAARRDANAVARRQSELRRAGRPRIAWRVPSAACRSSPTISRDPFL